MHASLFTTTDSLCRSRISEDIIKTAIPLDAVNRQRSSCSRCTGHAWRSSNPALCPWWHTQPSEPQSSDSFLSGFSSSCSSPQQRCLEPHHTRTHARTPRGFITAYPTCHECISSILNTHNPSAGIHTHVNTYIFSGAHVCNWRYFFFPCRTIVSTSTYVWARPAVTSDNLASYIQTSYLISRGKASSTDFEARPRDTTLQSLNTSTVGFELGRRAWHPKPAGWTTTRSDGRSRRRLIVTPVDITVTFRLYVFNATHYSLH